MDLGKIDLNHQIVHKQLKKSIFQVVCAQMTMTPESIHFSAKNY